MEINKKKKTLLKNTVMLYILTFSTYLLSFIVVPYETRVLGPDKYGLLGVTTAVMVYFQLVIDFGFLLSATEEVSLYRSDKKKLSEIFTCVTIDKLLLSFASFIVLFGICGFINQWRENMLFFVLFFLATAVNSMIPDYLYRGIEKMEAITFRTVLVKVFFTVMVFFLVKKPEDYLLIPLLQLTGNLIALIAAFIHLKVKIKVFFCRCKFKAVWERLRTSATFFLSRIATTVYTVTNTVVLDLFFKGSVTAYYSTADKLVVTAKSGLSPISDSLYPYMVKNRDFQMAKKLLLFLEPIIILGCAILFIWAEPLCKWLFGAEYGATGNALRAMLPIVIMTLPSYILGFPVLGVMGLKNQVNFSVIIGAIIHAIDLFILLITGCLNLISLGIAASIAEGIILTYRVVVLIKNRHLLKDKKETQKEHESV